jgi:hypothetical protein
MGHPFTVEVARELALRGVATLRYQFPHDFRLDTSR